jgi:hypothetical protein
MNLTELPVSEVKEVCARIGFEYGMKNHTERCLTLSRWLKRQHEAAILKAPDASWMPPCFEEYVADWVKNNFGR